MVIFSVIHYINIRYVLCFRYAEAVLRVGLDEGTEEDLTQITVNDSIGKLLRNLLVKLVKKQIIVIDYLVS